MKHKAYNITSPEEAASNMAASGMNKNLNWRKCHSFNMVLRYLSHTTMSQSLLDFGCGNGLFLEYLRSNNCSMSLTGYDPYLPRSIVGGKLHTSIEDVKDKQYDFITAIDVIEHIEDSVGTLCQINRLLKPTGTLLLVLPAFPFSYSLWDAKVGHYRRYTQISIIDELKKADLFILDFFYFFSFLIPPAIARKYYLALRSLWRKDHHCLDLSIDLLKIFTLLTKIEYSIIHKTNFRPPCGTSIFVRAAKNIIGHKVCT